VETGDYRYWLRVPEDGASVWAGPASVSFVPGATALRFEIGPNPFVERIGFRWNAPAGPARLAIHDLGGRRMRSLQPVAEAGELTAVWDGRDEQGRVAPAGVYLARLRFADGRTLDRKILRLR
jgi:hypothetical protein